MEEDKMKLFINHYEELRRCKDVVGVVDRDFFFEFADYLIARNKELEEEIQKDKNKIDFLVGKKIEEIAKHGKEVKIRMDTLYVPKYKIKEKIDYYKAYENLEMYEHFNYGEIVQVLQELLGLED